MRIIVPIKQVPETNAVRMDEETGTMIREGVEAIVNPLDLYAVEAAIRLREHLPSGTCETVAVSMGPPNAAAALREVMAMGIDSAVLLSDKAFAGSDTWATSYALARAIERMGSFELVICGERATDGETGQVGPAIAAWLELPVVTYVGKIERLADGAARVRRLVEDGYEILEVKLPAVITVVKEIANPRLPTLRGKQRAKRYEPSILKPADLDIPEEMVGLAGSPTRVVRIHRPRVARRCKMIPAGDGQAIKQAVDKLIDLLKEKDLL